MLHFDYSFTLFWHKIDCVKSCHKKVLFNESLSYILHFFLNCWKFAFCSLVLFLCLCGITSVLLICHTFTSQMLSIRIRFKEFLFLGWWITNREIWINKLLLYLEHYVEFYKQTHWKGNTKSNTNNYLRMR